MITIETYQTKPAAIETAYRHDRKHHGRQWTATITQSQTGSALTAGLYATVCFTCNPSRQNSSEQTIPNTIPGITQNRLDHENRKDLDR